MHVIVSPAADRHIDRLDPLIARRVYAKLRELQDNARPHGCLLLHDVHPPTWRVRVGDWRIFYKIDDRAGTVTITGVRHRGEAY